MPTTPATAAFDGLTYNSRRPHIAIPEYGRVVHEMIAHCITIEDNWNAALARRTEGLKRNSLR